jgi:hypothetical protein
LNSQRLLLYDAEDVSCTPAGHSDDAHPVDIPHLDLKKQKNLPPENLTGGALP